MTDDDDLTGRLTRLLGGADPAPEAVLAAARDALLWRDPDAALATLVADSATEAAGVRGDASRMITFVGGDIVIDVEVGEVGQRLHLVGQVAPPGPVELVVEQPGGTVPVVTDALGRFTVEAVAPGLTRFVCTSSDHRIRTQWTSL